MVPVHRSTVAATVHKPNHINWLGAVVESFGLPLGGAGNKTTRATRWCLDSARPPCPICLARASTNVWVAPKGAGDASAGGYSSLALRDA